MRREWAVYVLLAAAAIAVYGRMYNYEFINYDDRQYVLENPYVRTGLTPESIAWAFTTRYEANWHPLTWLSHMLDCQLFGLKAGPPHLVSLGLHIAATLLLYAALRRMTGSVGRSAVVAALFAVHPLHVQSVAWVSERKDVLSAVFWMLTMLAYARYAARPSVGRYLPVFIFLALGLMAKPMLVTLPLVLLLLDFWPLGRVGAKHPYVLSVGHALNPLPLRERVAEGRVRGCRGSPPHPQPLSHEGRGENGAAPDKFEHPPYTSIGRLVLEKVPLFLLAAASSVVTFMVQHGGGAVLPVSRVSLGMRAANAVVSYVEYLRKTFWPSDLAVFYPRLTEIPWWHVAAAGAALAAVTALAVWQLRRRPYLAVGWFWYLGTLVPVIGLVQVGEQALADRYTYIPLIGIFVSIVWGVGDLCAGARLGRAAAAAGAAAAGACLIVAAVQVRYWENNFLLYQHAIDVVPDNYLAHGNLGMALADDGRLEAAVAEFEQAVAINPEFAAAHNNLGAHLAALGRPGGALFHLREAVRLDPESAMGRSNLGIALKDRGLTDEAIREFREALRLDPEHARAHVNLGLILTNRGQTAEAMEHLRAAVRLEPDLAEAHNCLGRALDQAGKFEEAAAEYREAIRLRPDHAFAHHNLGLAMAALGRREEAVRLAEAACRLTARREPACLAALASAYADAGRFAEAVAAAEEARALAAALGRRDLAGLIDGRLPFYRAGRPHRETPGPQSRNVK